ncbi:uncharacterized protein [Anolis sagrei]|uniref:uncharacterized protein n=1 Tax=Anolis sagrei TaxID=38937 RepID=UPI003522C892
MMHQEKGAQEQFSSSSFSWLVISTHPESSGERGMVAGCANCPRKIPDSDSHALCLLCLGEAHITSSCRHCQSLTAQSRKNRVHRLRYLLYQQTLAPIPSTSTSASTSAAVSRPSTSASTSKAASTPRPVSPSAEAEPRQTRAKKAAQKRPRAAMSTTSKASVSTASKATKPTKQKAPCTVTTETVRIRHSSTSSVASVRSIRSTRSTSATPPSSTAVRIAFRRSQEESRRASTSSSVPPTPGKSVSKTSQPPAKKKKTMPPPSSSSSSSRKQTTASSATSSARSSPLQPVEPQPAPQPAQEPQSLPELPSEQPESPVISVDTVIEAPTRHVTARQELFPSVATLTTVTVRQETSPVLETPERGRQTMRLALARANQASTSKAPPVAPLQLLSRDVSSSPPPQSVAADDEEEDGELPRSVHSGSVLSLGIERSPTHDAYEADPPSPTDNVRAFADQMAQVIQGSWKTPSSIPPTSKKIESWYRTDDEGLEWLKHHPNPNSVVVKAAQGFGRQSSAPSDREGKRFDAVGRKLYYGALLLARMANYGACMGGELFGPSPDADGQTHGRHRGQDDCSRRGNQETCMAQVLWPFYIREAEDLPFDALGLFNAGTDDKLKSNHDYKTLASKCGFENQNQAQRTRWFQYKRRHTVPYRTIQYRQPTRPLHASQQTHPQQPQQQRRQHQQQRSRSRQASGGNQARRRI